MDTGHLNINMNFQEIIEECSTFLSDVCGDGAHVQPQHLHGVLGGNNNGNGAGGGGAVAAGANGNNLQQNKNIVVNQIQRHHHLKFLLHRCFYL